MQQHILKVDIPAVWSLVLLDDWFSKFFSLPWPGVAAFLAAVYTFFRLVGMLRKWWRT